MKTITQKLKEFRKEKAISKENTAYYRAKEMFELHKRGKTLREIAKIYKISHVSVCNNIDKFEAGLFGHNLSIKENK